MVTATLGVLHAIALLLAVRFLLLLSLVGGFVLALLAMQSQSTPSIEIVIAYAVLVILPMVYLASRERRPGS